MKKTQQTTAQQRANKKQNEKRQQQEKIPSIVMDDHFAELVKELTKIHGSKSAVVKEAVYQLHEMTKNKKQAIESSDLQFIETDTYYFCGSKKINYLALKPKGQVWMSTSTKEEILENIESYKEDEKDIELEFIVTNFDDFKQKVAELDAKSLPFLWV